MRNLLDEGSRISDVVQSIFVVFSQNVDMVVWTAVQYSVLCCRHVPTQFLPTQPEEDAAACVYI